MRAICIGILCVFVVAWCHADCTCNSGSTFSSGGKNSLGDCPTYQFGDRCACGDMFGDEGCDGCGPGSDEGCQRFDSLFEANESAWQGCWRDPWAAVQGLCVTGCQPHHCVDADGLCWPCSHAVKNSSSSIPAYERCQFHVNGSSVCQVTAGDSLLAVWEDGLEAPMEVHGGRNLTILRSVDDNPRSRQSPEGSQWVFKYTTVDEGHTTLVVQSKGDARVAKMDVIVRKR